MLLTLLVVLLLSLLLLRLALKERRHPLHGVLPNVSQLPIIGAAWELRHFQPDNLHEKFAEYVSRFGRSFMASFCGEVVMVTIEPRYVDALLLNPRQLRKSSIYGALRGWLGNGLLLSSGERWHTMRKIITPSFHFSILEQFVEVFDRQCNVLIDKLQPLADGEQVINIFPFMGLATLDIITETAMGVSINAQLDESSQVVQAVKDVTNILATRFMRPHLLFNLCFRLCWPSAYRKQREGVAYLHEFTDSIIERRRQLLEQQQREEKAEQPSRKCAALLDTLLKSRPPLSDAQIRDEVSTFIFEGHDTTTAASSFCLYLLSRNATVQQQLFKELREHYGDNVERGVSHSDFAALHYLHCVVKEALRLYPPIPAVGRWLEKDLVVGDLCLPAGTNVIVLLWELLRDETIYEEPLRFWPERHLAAEGVGSYSYLPFSAGPRNCVGQRFALFEVKTIVIKMLRNFELLPLGADVQPSIKIVLRSRTGVNFGLRKRAYV